MPNHEYALTDMLETTMPDDTLSEEQQVAPLLTLMAQVDPDGQAAATLPIGWCVSSALIERLKQEHYKRPHLLLVVRHKQTIVFDEFENDSFADYRETAYYVVPLTQGLVFVSFIRPGDNEIIPFIIDLANFEATREAYKLKRSTTSQHILTNNGERAGNWPWNNLPRYLAVNFRLEVKVPAEMFAPEPKPWMKNLVQLFYGGRERETDQCHFRRKLILSLLAVVPFIVLGTAFKLLTLLVGLLLTRRRYNLKHLVRPLYGELTGVWSDIDGKQDHSFWWHDKHGNRRPWPFWVYNHLTVFAVPAAVFGFFNIPNDDKEPWVSLGWWDTFLMVNGVMFGLGLVALTIFVLISGVLWLLGKLSDSGSEGLQRKLEAERQAAHDRRREEVLRELAAMICNGAPRTPSLEALPAHKRTVSLRFHDLKTKVCRPFAR